MTRLLTSTLKTSAERHFGWMASFATPHAARQAHGRTHGSAGPDLLGDLAAIDYAASTAPAS